ncbi:V-type ATP synthase subunit F [Guggenheimella bovis]
MKAYLLSRKRDLVTSFRLLGIEGERVEKDAFERLMELLESDKYSVLFLGDSLTKGHEEEIQALKAQRKTIIYVLPEEGGDYLKMVRESIQAGLGMKV